MYSNTFYMARAYAIRDAYLVCRDSKGEMNTTARNPALKSVKFVGGLHCGAQET
jgi:hypothetical protein